MSGDMYRKAIVEFLRTCLQRVGWSSIVPGTPGSLTDPADSIFLKKKKNCASFGFYKIIRPCKSVKIFIISRINVGTIYHSFINKLPDNEIVSGNGKSLQY
ncbi:hypothetical protein FRX31_019420 [Thalictrum thalictroides]|uniref:Uncharacterized protein n=1 Tax=Thalictrum thalictroides TaxID=46969 RepID=A0A7J6W3U0_THATH|nr:hypothetical protein FRX31_019420 [Thalictrum thalictroides]